MNRKEYFSEPERYRQDDNMRFAYYGNPQHHEPEKLVAVKSNGRSEHWKKDHISYEHPDMAKLFVETLKVADYV